MKLALAILSTTLFFYSSSLFADVIECRQTEPFIAETFNTDSGVVSIKSIGDSHSPKIETGLKFIIKEAGRFEIKTSDGSTRRTLLLNYQGSDGMSDLVYPFDGGQGVNGPIGCESTELKAKK